EALNPGYLKAAWHWDVAGRFSEQLTGAEPYFGYYIHLLKTEHFVHWFFIAGAGILLGLFSIDERIRKVTVFASCSALCFIVIISSAKTQMLWYEAPVYPLAALLVAAAVYWLIDVLQSLIKNLVFNFIPYLLIIKLIFIPYKEILNSVNPPRFKANWEPEAQALNLYLMDAYKSGRNLDGYNWVDDDWYNPYIYFHVKMFEENRGQVIQQKHLDSLNARETVIGFLNTVKPEIEKRYQFDVLEEKEFVKVYRIKGRKRR
ncbi:MAG TPA: hypothetical protein VEC12_13005, partial [Bacteroidia bacterium]|nr:hypothetical protein [Bacteroidia bacterium]